MTRLNPEAPTLALLPWGDVIEDYLDGIGVPVEAFATEVEGGWLFGYVEALRRAGVRTVLACVSANIASPTRFVHRPTGAAVWVLPASRAFRRLRSRMHDPMGWTMEAMFGPARGPRRLLQRLIRDVTPYLATPPRLLARVLRDEDCDAILCQEYEYPRFDVCVVVGQRLGLPVYATFQGGDWQTSRIERLVRPRSMQAAAGFIVPTRTEAVRMQAAYGVPDCKVTPIFNPLDVEAWRMPPMMEGRSALGIPADAEVVGWHGRVDLHRKGLDVLLDAWREVVAARPGRDLQLLLVGTGSEAELLRNRLAAPGFEAVRWIDEYVLDRDQLRIYLAAADVYAFPSRHEGFPVALVEALASGLPVAASAAPGVPDILSDDLGLIVPVGEAPPLADALGRLLDAPEESRAMGVAARQHAEEHFGLDTVGAQLRAFLLPGYREPAV